MKNLCLDKFFVMNLLLQGSANAAADPQSRGSWQYCPWSRAALTLDLKCIPCCHGQPRQTAYLGTVAAMSPCCWDLQQDLNLPWKCCYSKGGLFLGGIHVYRRNHPPQKNPKNQKTTQTCTVTPCIIQDLFGTDRSFIINIIIMTYTLFKALKWLNIHQINLTLLCSDISYFYCWVS